MSKIDELYQKYKSGQGAGAKAPASTTTSQQKSEGSAIDQLYQRWRQQDFEKNRSQYESSVQQRLDDLYSRQSSFSNAYTSRYKNRKSAMTQQQKATYKLAGKVAQAVGTNIRLYHGTKEFGMYSQKNGEIWLNINAMFNGQSMMLFTLSHELVHMAKQWSPAEFNAFADELLEQFGEKGVSVEALIKKQMDKAKENGYELNEHEAYEEVIADACERMLLDSDAVQKMVAYKAKNPSRWQQIVDAITEFIDNIRKLFVGAEPDSEEAALYKELDAAIREHLENKFVKMVMDTSDT